jgi:calcineurin-like phosphoesterase family protein
MFFVSDMHFGHNSIITYCGRPYANTEEMDDALVRNWNDTVGTTDTVYHLGDWAFGNYERIGELRGRIISVPGNHDLEREKKLLPFLHNGFTPEIVYLKHGGHRFTLCHYPFQAWRREYKYHLHGHTHGTASAVMNRLDVGIDATKLYRPIHLDEVVARLEGY